MHVFCADLCVHAFTVFMMHLCVCVCGGGGGGWRGGGGRGHLYCSAQLSMFNVEKRYRNNIIIIIAPNVFSFSPNKSPAPCFTLHFIIEWWIMHL